MAIKVVSLRCQDYKRWIALHGSGPFKSRGNNPTGLGFPFLEARQELVEVPFSQKAREVVQSFGKGNQGCFAVSTLCFKNHDPAGQRNTYEISPPALFSSSTLIGPLKSEKPNRLTSQIYATVILTMAIPIQARNQAFFPVPILQRMVIAVDKDLSLVTFVNSNLAQKLGVQCCTKQDRP